MEERAIDVIRSHPVLSVLGAAAIGMFGGIKVAAGVLIGAGVFALANDSGDLTERIRAVVNVARAPEASANVPQSGLENASGAV